MDVLLPEFALHAVHLRSHREIHSTRKGASSRERMSTYQQGTPLPKHELRPSLHLGL